jgi:dihydroorotate dehydrogenase (fumarate)
VQQLQQAGAAGVTLFNRFYQPDIDLETLEVKPSLHLSTSQEALERIRWVAILRQHVSLSLAITGGVHSAEDTLKGLLAGADACCLASALIENGAEHVEGVLNSMRDWMEQREYESVNQLKGSLSYAHAINPADYERANYLEVLDSYSYASGVMV